MAVGVDQDFIRQVECYYRGEHYSVRDNGAILRHSQESERPLDNIWTFGRPTPDGYLYFRDNPVHRIVATAYLGDAPTADHVVDHIDTNRQNNRPENLRWLTKLENILNNPITISKIVYRCGSLESFLQNPAILRDIDTDNSWMRTVTRDEAKNALDNLLRLSNTAPGAYEEWARKKEGKTKNREWLFQPLVPQDSTIARFPEDVRSAWELVLVHHRNMPRLFHFLNEAEYENHGGRKRIVLRANTHAQKNWIHEHLQSEFERVIQNSSVHEILVKIKE